MAKRRFLIGAMLLAWLLVVGCGAPTPTSEPLPPAPEPAPIPTPSPPEPTPPSKTEAVEVQKCQLLHFIVGEKPTEGAAFLPTSHQTVLFGELINNTSHNVKLIKLMVALKDEDKGVPLQGRGVGQDVIRILVPIIRPAEVTPFVVCAARGYKANEFDVTVQDYQRTTEELYSDIEVVECEGRRTTEELYSDMEVADVEWEGYRRAFDDPPATCLCQGLFMRYDCYVVEGLLRNIGSREARNVRVVCTFYDYTGRVVYADEYRIDMNPLQTAAAGRSASSGRGYNEDTFAIPALCSPRWVYDFKIQIVAE